MPATTATCPKCHNPIAPGSKFCPDCGNDITGIWGANNPALGGTIAVEADPNVDVLGQMLSEATLGDYDIYGELGRGGMAAVYLALDLSLNRKVAIKTMLPELVSREGMVPRFKREAQTSAALNHPHIIQIYSVKETPKLVFFVMKFIEGRALESVITDKGRVPLSMTQTILGQVGSALDYAHRKHVVHRDIKPANIMIDEDGWAIVTDFGIAKVQEAQNLTATGTAIGTPHYMSPEQFHNKAVTGASDQYSLGVVLYEMLSGKKPFDGGTYAEIITQHLFEPVPDIRQLSADIPEHVNDVIQKMMAKNPADRFPDLDTAIHALGAPASKKEGDVIRTQMISLAKSGPQKKVRMSVPMSPIPETKKRAVPSKTAVEPKKSPAPVAKASGGSGMGKWIGIAATVAVLAGGGYYVKVVNPQLLGGSGTAAVKQQGGTPADEQAQVTPPSPQPNAPTNDSSAVNATAAAELEKQRTDSIARVAREKARQDSINLVRATERRLRDSIRIAQAVEARVQKSVEPTRPPVAATPQFATIRLASSTPAAAVYIDNNVESLIASAREVTVPAGVQVRVQIRAPGCTPWDTTILVAPGSKTPVGRRNPRC